MALPDQLAVGDQSYDDAAKPRRPTEGTWPRKSPSPRAHVRTGSSGYREPTEIATTSYNDLNRTSMGPSIIQSSMTTVPSKSSLKQRNTRGFRAAIRRLFGSKRRTTSFSETRNDYHRSVCIILCSSAIHPCCLPSPVSFNGHPGVISA
jgi:hypothetical protein